MAKLTLTDLVNLENQTTAVNAINANNALIEAAVENTFSRDGTSPNTLTGNLDMNNKQILNLPAPAGAASPVRLQDVVSPATIASVPPVGTSGAVVGLLNANKTDSGNNTFSGTNAFNGVATLAAPVITGNPTIYATVLTGKTGTGNLVLATSPTISSPTMTTPVLGTPTSGTLTNCTGLPIVAGTTGNLTTARLNSGTNASATTFWRGDGTWDRPVLSTVSNVLGADVALNNTGTYFDGPSVSAGTGIWFVVGTVSLNDTASLAGFNVKLWDGSTVIATGRSSCPSSTLGTQVTLSGIITNPSGNLRMSANDPTSVNGNIKFNGSGNSKDSSIWAIRIG